MTTKFIKVDEAIVNDVENSLRLLENSSMVVSISDAFKVVEGDFGFDIYTNNEVKELSTLAWKSSKLAAKPEKSLMLTK